MRFKADSTDSGKRADVFITEMLPKFTRSSLKGLFSDGKVKIGDQVAKAGHKLSADDQIQVDIGSLTSRPIPIDIPIIYEDEEVIVMDKSAGLLTHSKGALNTEATVASFLANKITDKNLTGNRAGIVHRLDRGTSGVIIGAKTDAALKQLQKQFATRKTFKTYIAIVLGEPQPATAVIDAPIGRNPRHPQTFKVITSGRPAQTEYKVLKSFQKNDRTYSLLELQPKTGRTHQLRVHLAYIGYPIVGDHVYGKDDGRMMLHAAKLKLRLPSGEEREFESELPKEFIKFSKDD